MTNLRVRQYFCCFSDRFFSSPAYEKHQRPAAVGQQISQCRQGNDRAASVTVSSAA